MCLFYYCVSNNKLQLCCVYSFAVIEDYKTRCMPIVCCDRLNFPLWSNFAVLTGSGELFRCSPLQKNRVLVATRDDCSKSSSRARWEKARQSQTFPTFLNRCFQIMRARVDRADTCTGGPGTRRYSTVSLEYMSSKLAGKKRPAFNLSAL